MTRAEPMMHPLSTRELPTLATPRLRLRHLAESDAPALFEIFSDPEVTRYWSRPPMRGMAEALELVREVHGFATEGTLLQWGVTLADDPAWVVGTCTLSGLHPRHRRAEIGFAVARSHWGRGIAGEAAGRVVRHAFETLGLHRLAGDADPRNTASIRILRRLGFRPEGHLREHYWQSEEWQDALLFGLLRRDWTGGG